MTSSLFDELFKLKNTAPETDVDPEDPVDGKTAMIPKNCVVRMCGRVESSVCVYYC